MMPHARVELVEVATAVLVLAFGAPETYRLAGKRSRADEIASFARGGYVSACVVPGRDSHAQAADLDLARMDGSEWGGCAKEGYDVCAAGYAAEVYGGGKCGVDVVEGRGGERGAGAVDCLEGFKGERGAWGEILLLENR